jgi:UPF0755 protein
MLFLAMVAAVVALVWSGLGAPVAKRAAARVFTVAPGWGTGEIAAALARLHLIRSALYFRVLADLSGRARQLEAGVYLLSPAESPAKILDLLATGRTAVHRVTIPEGYTAAEIAARLATDHVVSAAAFLQAAHRFRNPYLPPHAKVRDPAEGYLFPATYAIPYRTSAEGVLRLMFATFRRQVTPQDVAAARREHLSVNAWVTLASIVERETRLARERAVVAAVFLNRLRRHMPLQSDATVLYAIGGGSTLTAADLHRPSPYNTYLVPALPPGPIANPGLGALMAVLHPARVAYLYFVGRPDGSHIFSDTYAEQLHAEAVVAREGGGARR